MQAAKAAGAVVSFDLNYRAKLWAAHGGDKKAQEVTSELVRNVDVLVGNEEDMQLSLGISGPEGAKSSALDATRLRCDAREGRQPVPERQGRGHHPARGPVGLPPPLERGGLGRTARPTRRRSWTSTSSTAWVAATASPAACSTASSPGCPLEESVRLGWAHGALLTTFPGDTTMATLAQVKALAAGGSARIQR